MPEQATKFGASEAGRQIAHFHLRDVPGPPSWHLSLLRARLILRYFNLKKNPDFLNKKIRALSSTFQNRFITCQKFYHRVASDLKPTL